ncbi:MAG: carboxypeptidase-like regulatory domain-containing protein [Acidobacteriota bacterium]|jgi:5-hydroxyisourate hydrolase-like protein (transthyretin family)|nr:carboxypeptidase-like regulatory domain-containing protein [Acidobacteriota bacterium]
MRSKFVIKLVLILAVFICFGVVTSNAQQVSIRIEKPFLSKVLSGVITDTSGEPLPAVTVELLNCDWGEKIDSISTDENGKFRFPNIYKGTHFLRFKVEGFNELEVRIKLTDKTKRKLNFKMEVST